MLLAVAALQGCSPGYRVRATVIERRLAFASDDQHFDCIQTINVSSRRARAEPAPGDSVWEIESPDLECTVSFPVFFGVAPRGMLQTVSPKSLEIGVPYAVRTQGDGAYGSGCFMITHRRTVQNLAAAECWGQP